MNGNLRHAMHKRNMLYNKYKKGLATWRSYKSQRNLTTSVYKKSKSNYFRERCEGGNKNQRFWKTIKPFMSNKGGLRNSKIILKNGHSIVSDDKEVCELFNEYFSSVASNIGFSDDIPDDYNTDHGFQCILKKYENHPSIC